MIKLETIKQTNKFMENYKKFESKLFNLKAIGSTKQEAEKNLLDLIEWNLSTFYKVFQHENLIVMLRRDSNNIGNYRYSRIQNDLEQGVSFIEAKNDKDAIQKANVWFNQMIQAL